MVTALQDVRNRIKALEIGADDFLVKPVEATELKARVKSLLKIKAYNDHMLNYQKELEGNVAHRTSQLREALAKLKGASLETIHRLSRAAEYKDEGTGAHLQRMSHYSVSIATTMGLDTAFVEGIRYAAPMHDTGKIGIPDRILLKQGKLNRIEWQIMKDHTVIGAQIMAGSNTSFIQQAEVIALSHHERWDGRGYPQGLKGKQIPLAGRITAVADVFDALTSKRPYKEAFPLEKSMEIIEKDKGKHFDPEVVDAFFAATDEILATRKAIAENNYTSKFLATSERSKTSN
jgi:putative two-component system response regulator